MNRVLKKLREDNKEFVTSIELRKYCKDLYFNYKIVLDYLISRKFMLRIFDDVFYVKKVKEVEENKISYSLLEIVAKSLEVKGINHWYYGLYTALTLNSIKYDHKDKFFYIINNYYLKNKPIKILNKEFRFLRFKNVLFNFGIIKNKIKYSDYEKTILDFIYLRRYDYNYEKAIIIEISKFLKGISEEKIIEYSQYYPKSNRKILKGALNYVQGKAI